MKVKPFEKGYGVAIAALFPTMQIEAQVFSGARNGNVRRGIYQIERNFIRSSPLLERPLKSARPCDHALGPATEFIEGSCATMTRATIVYDTQGQRNMLLSIVLAPL